MKLYIIESSNSLNNYTRLYDVFVYNNFEAFIFPVVNPSRDICWFLRASLSSFAPKIMVNDIINPTSKNMFLEVGFVKVGLSCKIF